MLKSGNCFTSKFSTLISWVLSLIGNLEVFKKLVKKKINMTQMLLTKLQSHCYLLFLLKMTCFKKNK